MPIVGDGPHAPVYDERERTSATDLCDARGRLDPAAIGWSRRPLVRANLSGHWPRKKRWNFWNWITPRFVFSVTLADIDYAAFCQVTFIDFETKRSLGAVAPTWPGTVDLPEHVDRSVQFRGRAMRYENVRDGDVARVVFNGKANGSPIDAAFTVHAPGDHESLNVVVPWSPTRFQLNSKHNTLPCDGIVTVGGREYALRPEDAHGVQDYGRGIWPYRSFWNWAVATGTADGIRVGVNLGGKWTTGTGTNENGIMIDGRLHKVTQDVRWDYDPTDWMRPWRVHTENSRAIDLTLQPMHAHKVRTTVGILSTAGVCCFGRWTGTVHADGTTLQLRDLVGWAEEFAHRW
jgi:hypothetical protein